MEAEMNFSSINWLAVIACVVVSMIVGSLWYNPKTFFPIWWKAIGRSESDAPGMQNMGMIWGLVVLASFVQAVFMALMVNAMGSMTGGATLASGATAGFILWLGFVAPSSLTNKLFAGQFKAWFIEVGNHLVTFVLFGAILGAWH
jgi:Protein of unknown function (DUF1761)